MWFCSRESDFIFNCPAINNLIIGNQKSFSSGFRIQQACCLLKERNRTITDVMGSVGFSESSYFTRVFRREVGVSPSEYQRGKRGAGSSTGC